MVEFTSTTSSFSTDSSVLFLATKSYLDLANSVDGPLLSSKLLQRVNQSQRQELSITTRGTDI